MLRKMVGKFRIQYTSDLHLELYKQIPRFESLLQPVAPYLALAGDIGHPPQLRELFTWAAPQWKRIFYLPGNHEYYGAILEEREEELRMLVSEYENIHFLHPSSPFFCEEENVAILGGTLWSEVPRATRWRKCNDYKMIRTNVGNEASGEDPGLSVFHRLNALHNDHKELLDKQIELWENRGAQLCVITHHLPSYNLIHPHFWGYEVNHCFASTVDSLLRAPVRLWIYGHSHTCSNMTVRNILCVSNAKGYVDERVPGWRPDVWMEFPIGDPQELEAASKVHETPLQTDEIEFV